MPNTQRRQLSVPIQATYRSTSPSPQSAPPVSNHPSHSSINGDVSTSNRRAQPTFLPPVRKRSLPLASRSTHPLQMEIDRLTAVCEEHERVIRSSLSTIKHHVMTNMPDVFERVNKIDDDAEVSQLQQTLSAHIPPFQSHLQRIVFDRSADVDLMEKRTTPWKDVVSDLTTSTALSRGLDKDEGSASRMKRISELDGGEGDALTRIEMWADEVDMYLSSEIVRVKEKLASKTSKRQFLLRVIVFLTYALVAIVLASVLGMLVKKGYDHIYHNDDVFQ
uniref:Uncharacterized protein n=1 Tax=Kwoniella bestiolae CBS 10118 TaxID=1296100 RepID=A0A1B9G3B9_9TREE|nr:hypothetical protein I302_05326 [Kwoniella bestiolae CBS 10118]OCF25506.1 hypothetical protein I302_05326 [Kwoniella bestiolae CBS 10118]